MKTRTATVLAAFALVFTASTLVPAVSAAAPNAVCPAQVVPGELLVVLKNGLSAAQVAAFARAHHVRGTYLSTVNIYVAELPEAQVPGTMARMNADPNVVSVERSYVMKAAT